MSNSETPEVKAPIEIPAGIDGEGGYIFHVLGHFKQRIQDFVTDLTENELLILLSFLTGATLGTSGAKAATNKSFSDLATRWSVAYPEVIRAAKEKGLLPMDSTALSIIVPLIPGINYNERPDVRLYLLKPSTTNIQ